MSLAERDDDEYEELEQNMEKFFEMVDYQEIEKDVLKDMYIDIRSRYNLVQEWREDETVDWVVVDDFLKETAEEATRFCEAYEP